MKIRAIAIDDDPLATLLVEKLAKNNKNVELIASYNDSVRGAAGIVLDRPDVLFLDIEMPEFNGIQIMGSMRQPPKVIVVSANPTYTKEALDLNAVTFINKPLNQETFDEAIEKVMELISV